jgi:hypothetical protein
MELAVTGIILGGEEGRKVLRYLLQKKRASVEAL